MSLPQATKEISPHPAKNAVTSPTDKAALQADVDHKMRLYGAIQAFRENKYPDNAQIDETLTYVIQHSPVDESRLSSEGRKLIHDVRDILETARRLVEEKNADELFQQFLYHTSHTEAELPSPNTAGVVDVSEDDVIRDREKAVEHLRTLMRLILTNSEARKLLSDIQIIGRDLFARGAVKAAESVRPSEDVVARADDAAPADEWVGPKGTRHGPHQRAPDILTDEQTSRARGALETGRGVNAEGANTKVDTATRGFLDRFSNKKGQPPDEIPERVNGVVEGVQGDSQQIREDIERAPEDEKGEVAKQGLKERFMSLKEKVPQEHRDRAGGHYERGKQFLQDEFPEERRDQWIYRLKKVIAECQKHQDYQDALTWFLSAIENYFGHGRALAEHHANKAGDVTDDPSLQRATTELRTLLERFANGRSVEPILEAADQLNTDAQNDEGLRNWFKDLDSYAHKSLLEPGFILSPQFTNEARRLQDTGHQFFDEKYRAHKDNLFNRIQGWFSSWTDDPLNARFGEDWKRLTKDLLFAEDGSLAYKAHLWSDIRKVIIPQLVSHIGYVPIPRIEYTDNQLDLVIENLTLEASNILPNFVTVTMDAHNYLEFSLYDAIPDREAHEVKFTFSQIQADMRDVAFYFHKKSGLPKIKDSGLADVFLGGEGLTVKVHLVGAGKDTSSVFHVMNVAVKVESLKFSVRDTKHDLLYKTLKPLATGLVKKQISKAISDAVRTGLEYLDEQLVAVRSRYQEARADPNVSATETLSKMFEHKSSEALPRSDSSKQKASTFKVVNKRDSVIIPEGHGSGWINKMEEREAAAKAGEGWKSPAFNIVSTASARGGAGAAPSAAAGPPHHE